jgi:tetratricopeptide (TPR) repeat protein
MVRAEFFLRRASVGAALAATLLLAACGSAPKVSEPVLRKQAQEAETDGARRYARGDYTGAVRSFGAAGQLQQSFDDPAAAARNGLNQAHAELALGQAEVALNRARHITHPELLLDALLLQAQANLALGRLTAAQETLAAAATACPANCAPLASLNLLQARVALADQRAPDALVYAQTALKLLQDKDEAAETGNAWRLIAAARLANGDASGALPAANAALEIDRRLALPEKIARDWLLIGNVQRIVGADDTAPAYQRALDVANAAGLTDIAAMATRALTAISQTKETAR